MGNCFLDEVGDIPLSLQVKLLRLLETGTFRRVGGVSDIKVDVRIVAATNKNLPELVEAGQFREDLYFRLNVLSLKIPPLRERPDDIPLLVNHFLKKSAVDNKSFSQDAITTLQNYHWKGNIRELENIVERVLLLSTDDVIGVESLPEEFQSDTDKDIVSISGSIDMDKLMEDTEKAYLLKALEETNGVKTEAAKLLGISRKNLWEKMKNYRLK